MQQSCSLPLLMSTMAGDDLHMHEYNGTQLSGARTGAARSASNKLIWFHSPVDPPRWPSLPPVTKRNLNGLSAYWDNVWITRLHGT
jgi:proteasome lid subunit RPN8/RPN11